MASSNTNSPRETPPKRVSDRVYRRRRMVVGLGAVIVLILVVAIGAGAINALRGVKAGTNNAQSDNGAATTATNSGAPTTGAGQGATPGAEDSASSGPQPSGTNSAGTPSPTGSAESSANPNACAQESIEVSASTDKPSYAPEEKPVLSLTVKNIGQKECSVNVGTTQQNFTITSGDDRIFSTADCAKDPVDLEKSIAPGQSEKANFVWQRQRSAPGCQPVQSVPGPGTYKLQVSLGQQDSKSAVFNLQ